MDNEVVDFDFELHETVRVNEGPFADYTRFSRFAFTLFSYPE